MSKKRRKPEAGELLDDLIRAYMLRRLEGGSPALPKPAKRKRPKKR